MARSDEDLGGLAVPRAEELGGEAPVVTTRYPLHEPGFDVEPAPDELGSERGFEPRLETGRAAEPRLAGIAAGPGGDAGPDLRVEELERRLAHLEKRLEEMAEVKDRLDRQLNPLPMSRQLADHLLFGAYALEIDRGVGPELPGQLKLAGAAADEDDARAGLLADLDKQQAD